MHREELGLSVQRTQNPTGPFVLPCTLIGAEHGDSCDRKLG